MGIWGRDRVLYNRNHGRFSMDLLSGPLYVSRMDIYKTREILAYVDTFFDRQIRVESVANCSYESSVPWIVIGIRVWNIKYFSVGFCVWCIDGNLASFADNGWDWTPG